MRQTQWGLWARLAVVLAVGAFMAGCATTGAQDGKGNPIRASQINVRLGLGYMKQGRLDVALGKLKRAIQQNPDSPDANIALGRLYVKRGDPKAAVEYYEKAVDLAPDDPSVQNSYGVFLCRHGKAGASERYFRAAASNPDYSTPEAAYTNAGICLLKVDKTKRAQADFRQALKTDPHYAPALQQLAQMYYQQKQYLKTRAFTQRYMEQVKKPGPSMLWLAVRTERALGAKTRARRYLKQLVSEYPESRQTQQAAKAVRK